MKNPFFSIAC